MASSSSTEAEGSTPPRLAPPKPTWVRLEAPDEVSTLVEAGLPPVLAPLLARRGVIDPTAAERYLAPSIDQLHAPKGLHGLQPAVDRLVSARDTGESVTVVGDYDVDGVSSTAIVSTALKVGGVSTRCRLPHRMQDGYGLQITHVDEAIEAGSTVLLTVDCGTTSHEPIERALAGGLDVIVVDHHLPGEPLPNEVVLVNPKQAACVYPDQDLCAAGLAFKVAHALFEAWGRPFPAEAFLRLAVLGTVADVVPLRGENRVITSLGLRSLAETRSVGLKALFRTSSTRPPFQASDIGFRIGPRLNAAGRMSSADHALELLLTRDPVRAKQLSEHLEELNALRRQRETQTVEGVLERIAERGELPPIVVEWSDAWHQGVVGLGASRVARSYHRPAILLTVRDGQATGSGRSVPGLDLHALVASSGAPLERFGGHAQAIGMTVAVDQLDHVRERLLEAAAAIDPALLEPTLGYELHLAAEEVTPETGTLLRRLEPHGPSNRRPLLRVGPLAAVGNPRRFGRGHLRVTAKGDGGGLVRLLGWGWQERADELEGRFEVVAALEHNSYDGGWDLRLLDARPATA